MNPPVAKRIPIFWITYMCIQITRGCVFYTHDGTNPEAEGVRFIRIREDLPTGKTILLLRAYPRTSIEIQSVDGLSDHLYFDIKEINATTAKVFLEKSLNDLVDQDVPQNLLKFRIVCTGHNGRADETAYTSVTVYVEDVNDHAPVFLNEPYVVEVDESTSPGAVVYENIQAFDRDKPNTPNSDVHLSIGPYSTDDGGPYFALESPHRPFIILKRSLDFDNGIRQFEIPIIASDRGIPVRRSNSTVKIIVKDNDDLPPKFTDGVYRTKINEFYPLTGKPIRIPLYFSPPIMAFDQDSLNASLIYDIISGNERTLFGVNRDNGVIYLEKEIDLEEESLPGNTFVLQIEARQKDSPLKRALARIEIEIVDLNDNAPEFEVEFYNISIVENLPTGFSVLQVNAVDRDQGENAEFYYKLIEEKPTGAFLIDSRTGWITVRDHTLLDREARPFIFMLVEAAERIRPYDLDRQTDSGKVQVQITLLDSNDNTPEFESGNLYEFKVNVQAGVNTIVGNVTAFDPDEGRNGMILYELQRPKGSGYIPFRLDSKSGTLFVSGPLRRGRIALFVEATDQPANPSERRFSLAVVTILVHAVVDENAIEFVGAPYEFWIGADVPVGSSVGQVRTTLDFEDDGELMYDLLHSYSEGVPFAIEEKSGIITVIRELKDFNRIMYYFEAVANYQYANHLKGHLTRRASRSEQQITGSGDIIEINEGVIANSENVLLTNVTIHVVSPNDDKGILMKGTNLNPIEFHIKENLSGAVIGKLMYKNFRPRVVNSSAEWIYSKNPKVRMNRNLNSKFRLNNTFRRKRDVSSEVAYVTPMVLFDDPTDKMENLPSGRSFDSGDTHRLPSVWHPMQTNEDSVKSFKTSTPPIGMRFIIANQQAVTNKITITEDGTLMTVTSLDREICDVYRLTIIAQYSKGFITGAGIYQVNVYVDDVNDNPPTFDSPMYTGMVYENCPDGTSITLNRPILIKDADLGLNAKFNLTLLGNGYNLFVIELFNDTMDSIKTPTYHKHSIYGSSNTNQSGIEMLLLHTNLVTTNEPYYAIKCKGKARLDRERESIYDLQIVATDIGGLSSTAQIQIIIADLNDNAPIFERIAVFQDSGVKLEEYSNEMEIYYIENPQMENTPYINKHEYSLPGKPRYASYSHLNDTMFKTRSARELKQPPLFTILEDVDIGVSVLKVTATDDDSGENSLVFYEISSEIVEADSLKLSHKNNMAKYFNIDRLSGEIKLSYPLQAKTNITIHLIAKDIGGLSDNTTIRFTVIDVNNHAPVFRKSWYSFDLLENDYLDMSIDRIEATDADYGQNAQISYTLESEGNLLLPFTISDRSGVLKVNGTLDRELRSRYEFYVVAMDGAESSQRLTSSVEVEINVLDVNDNAPEFIGYDGMETSKKIPIFKAYIDRNTTPGTFVKQVSAIDKDYAGNGNGLVMYSLLHNSLFEIDSRDGVIKTVLKFGNYASYEHINATVVASDLGSPPKRSMALLLVNLQGEKVVEESVPPETLFPHRYYELELTENNFFPVKLLQINVSYSNANEQFKWTIPESEWGSGDGESFPFQIDPKNGSVYIVRSLDREIKDMYSFKVRVEKVRSREGRKYPAIIYPIEGDRIDDLAYNEVQVVLQVLDENDNSPKFKGSGRPIVTVIPGNANFGFPVTQVEAYDIDEGKNADIRYKLLNEPSRLFGIDEISGKIRVLGRIDSSQRVYGFDVKATDRQGEDNGRSSIANVFVYVVEENRHVRLVIAGKPVDVEKTIGTLTNSLSEATGMDIRVRLLEPHIGSAEPATNAFIYAVDPKTNGIVDMEDLQNSMSSMVGDNFSSWPSPHILELSEFGKYPPRSPESSTMSGTQLVSIISAVLIFVGASATSLCVICVRQKRRPQFNASETGLTYSISRLPSSSDTAHTKTMVTTTGSPASKRSFQNNSARVKGMRPQNLSLQNRSQNYNIRPREYIDVPLPKSVLNIQEDHGRYSILQSNMIKTHHSGHGSSNCYANLRSSSDTPETVGCSKLKCDCSEYNTKHSCEDNADSSDSYEDSLRNEEYQHTSITSLPLKHKHSTRHEHLHFVEANHKNRQGLRHSFSGVRDDLVQDSPKVSIRTRGLNVRGSMSNLEQHLQDVQQSFRKPFHLEMDFNKNNVITH